MVKTSGEIEREFIATAQVKTGRSLQGWLHLVQSSGLTQRRDILHWLKNNFAINHLQAQLIAGIYLNHGHPVYNQGNELWDHLFRIYPAMQPIFERLAAKIIYSFEHTRLIPRKSYFAFTVFREFAAVQVNKNALWLGLDLGAIPFNDTLQKSTLLGPEPNMTHMLIFTSENQFDDQLTNLLTHSFHRTNQFL